LGTGRAHGLSSKGSLREAFGLHLVGGYASPEVEQRRSTSRETSLICSAIRLCLASANQLGMGTCVRAVEGVTVRPTALPVLGKATDGAQAALS
jgi:hypothetical protein